MPVGVIEINRQLSVSPNGTDRRVGTAELARITAADCCYDGRPTWTLPTVEEFKLLVKDKRVELSHWFYWVRSSGSIKFMDKSSLQVYECPQVTSATGVIFQGEEIYIRAVQREQYSPSEITTENEESKMSLFGIAVDDGIIKFIKTLIAGTVNDKVIWEKGTSYSDIAYNEDMKRMPSRGTTRESVDCYQFVYGEETEPDAFVVNVTVSVNSVILELEEETGGLISIISCPTPNYHEYTTTELNELMNQLYVDIKDNMNRQEERRIKSRMKDALTLLEQVVNG